MNVKKEMSGRNKEHVHSPTSPGREIKSCLMVKNPFKLHLSAFINSTFTFAMYFFQLYMSHVFAHLVFM